MKKFNVFRLAQNSIPSGVRDLFYQSSEIIGKKNNPFEEENFCNESRSVEEIINEGDEMILKETPFETNSFVEMIPIDAYFNTRDYLR